MEHPVVVAVGRLSPHQERSERLLRGIADEDHGVDHWARRGIAGRAVLCDVGRWRAAQGRPLQYAESDVIEPDDILAHTRRAGLAARAG